MLKYSKELIYKLIKIGCVFMKHEDLRRLNEMKEKGIISEEEYQKRRDLLASMRKSHVYHVDQSHKEDLDKIHNHNHHHSTHSQAPLNYHFHAPIDIGRRTYYIGKNKSKKIAGFLGIILGLFGIHNFYLGHHGKGIVQLLMTLLSFGSFVLWISFVWGFVEGILTLLGLIHKDAHGVELK